MKVVLAFPWRETPDRLEPYHITTDIVSRMYPFASVYTTDSGHATFNRPASRNLAFTVAEEAGADVVVLCDADSIPETSDQLGAAINGAAEDQLMHFPFDEAWYIDFKGMLRVKQRATRDQVRSRIWDKCPSEGGVWVCTPRTWSQAGGQDPRLAHWGCDDRAFLAASRTLVGMPVKHPGVLYCLPHTRPTEEEIWVPEEVQLLLEYESKYMSLVEMQMLVDSKPVDNNPLSKINFI